LDGPLPKLCPAVTLSHQDGCHSAVALLLKAALIQVSDYRLLGASGFHQGPLGYRFEFLEAQCFSFDVKTKKCKTFLYSSLSTRDG
jgi:hypothetical protein